MLFVCSGITINAINIVNINNNSIIKIIIHISDHKHNTFISKHLNI